MLGDFACDGELIDSPRIAGGLSIWRVLLFQAKFVWSRIRYCVAERESLRAPPFIPFSRALEFAHYIFVEAFPDFQAEIPSSGQLLGLVCALSGGFSSFVFSSLLL